MANETPKKISLYGDCLPAEHRMIRRAYEMSKCESMTEFVRRACVVTAREVIRRRDARESESSTEEET